VTTPATAGLTDSSFIGWVGSESAAWPRVTHGVHPPATSTVLGHLEAALHRRGEYIHVRCTRARPW